MGTGVFFLRLAVAALLGGLIGLERHRSDKAAGLRTHMLVSVGSALFMIVSAYGFDQVIQPGHVVLDPSRIAAQVVTGIGFLGAGMILRRNSEIHGLTTAASIWAVAAVGLAAGGGLYLGAAGATVLLLIILAGMKPLEDRMVVAGGQRVLTLVVRHEVFATAEIEDAIREVDLELVGVRIWHKGEHGDSRMTVTVDRATDAKLLTVLKHLQAISGVQEVGFEGRHSS